MIKSLYLYCIADGPEEVNLGPIGIAGHQVYTIVYNDLSAIVHDLTLEQEKLKEEILREWVITHQNVVDVALKKFGTILPLAFCTVIKGDEGIEPAENLKNWMRDDYENLIQKLAKVKGKAEYVIQIFWVPKIIGEFLMENDPDLKALHKEIQAKSKGLAYMYKQKLENLLKKKMAAKAEQYFNSFYTRIKECVGTLKVEKTKKVDNDKQMLLNLSCLITKEDVKLLGEELEEINNIKGIVVRFTGPWAPYSFV